MFRIGVFARLGQVSVRTIRFYDERGLLKPAHTDAQTGYRYYSADQIPRLTQILALRDFGFSLEEIAALGQQPLPPEVLRPLLEQKQGELRERMRKDGETLARIEARLHALHQEQQTIMNPTYDIAIRSVPPVLAAAVHATIPTREQVTPTLNRIFDQVLSYVHEQGATCTGPAFDVWFDEEMQNADMPVAACAPLAAPLPESAEVKMLSLPAVETMATTTHRGGFDKLTAAHTAIITWVGENGYKIVGPGRELYQVYERDGDPSQWVTEIQYPVTREA